MENKDLLDSIDTLTRALVVFKTHDNDGAYVISDKIISLVAKIDDGSKLKEFNREVNERIRLAAAVIYLLQVQRMLLNRGGSNFTN